MRVTGEVVRLNAKRPAARITDTLPLPQGLAKKRRRGGNSHGTRSILFGVHGIAGARPFSGNLKLRCCGIRRSKTPLFRVADADGVFFLRRIRSPGLSFSFLRTFSFFRPKERETAVLVETAVSGAESSQPQPPRQSGRRFPSRASVPRGAPRSPCPAISKNHSCPATTGRTTLSFAGDRFSKARSFFASPHTANACSRCCKPAGIVL